MTRMSHQGDLAEINRWQGEAQLDTLRREVASGQPDLRREFRLMAASWRKRLKLDWHRGCGHAVIPGTYEEVLSELWSWIHG